MRHIIEFDSAEEMRTFLDAKTVLTVPSVVIQNDTPQTLTIQQTPTPDGITVHVMGRVATLGEGQVALAPSIGMAVS